MTSFAHKTDVSRKLFPRVPKKRQAINRFTKRSLREAKAERR